MDVSLTDFYLLHSDRLFGDALFKKQIISHQRFLKFDHALSERAVFDKILVQFLEEAELTLSLIRNLDLTGKDVLEIGGGLGFVYGYLKKAGINIYGIEPSDSGFDGYFNAAMQLFKIIDADGSHFYPFSAKECTKLNRQFDVIFSNNVLEHIPELNESFSAMQSVLGPHGLMVHNTVNYHIPYEPHFKMMLFPFLPRFTEFFKPSLKQFSLWKGLNFITTGKLKRIGKMNNLNIVFKKDAMYNTLKRLENDPMFAQRQKYFIPLYRVLKLTGLTKILGKIPIALTTPIAFTIRKK